VSNKKDTNKNGGSITAYDYGSIEKEFTVVKSKNKQMPTVAQRKSLRNTNKNGIVRGMVEALKQKHQVVHLPLLLVVLMWVTLF
jgi:hypothetical protein